MWLILCESYFKMSGYISRRFSNSKCYINQYHWIFWSQNFILKADLKSKENIDFVLALNMEIFNREDFKFTLWARVKIGGFPKPTLEKFSPVISLQTTYFKNVSWIVFVLNYYITYIFNLNLLTSIFLATFAHSRVDM